jgi:plastocyanin
MRALAAAAAVVILTTSAHGAIGLAAQGAKPGTIQGHVRLTGPSPGNARIRMGADPKCNAFYRGGERPVQEIVVADAKGDLANVFVNLDGKFAATPVPSTPVVIDQQGCIFIPRVVGARVGQPLQIKNSDTMTHTAHSLTAKNNTFNVSQPKTGIVSTIALKGEETMLRVTCDIHSWMTAYIGVLPHPYFSVSDTAGTFKIANVPPGKYTIRAWHERFGVQMKTIEVKPGQAATVDFAYTGQEKLAK